MRWPDILLLLLIGLCVLAAGRSLWRRRGNGCCGCCGEQRRCKGSSCCSGQDKPTDSGQNSGFSG